MVKTCVWILSQRGVVCVCYGSHCVFADSFSERSYKGWYVLLTDFIGQFFVDVSVLFFCVCFTSNHSATLSAIVNEADLTFG